MFPQLSLGAARDRGQPQPWPAQRLGRAPGPACFSLRLCPKVDFWETGRDGCGGAVVSPSRTPEAPWTVVPPPGDLTAVSERSQLSVGSPPHRGQGIFQLHRFSAIFSFFFPESPVGTPREDQTSEKCQLLGLGHFLFICGQNNNIRGGALKAAGGDGCASMNLKMNESNSVKL